MKIHELLGYNSPIGRSRDNLDEMIGSFQIYTTNEEAAMLKRLKNPVKLSSLSEHEQFTIEGMVRKSLVTKIGMKDPKVVANEKINP
jgi:hypothetical protein